MKKKIKRLKSELKQLLSKNIKHPCSDIVGEKAKMMRQFYRAKIYIKEERVKSTIGIKTCSVKNSHPTVTDDPSAEITFQLHVSCHSVN